MSGIRYMLILAVGVCAGCAVPTAGVSQRRDAWVREQGGVIHDWREQRAESAMARVCRGVVGGRLTVRVLDCGEPGAYAWDGGDVFVTRGLVDLLDEDELAAAIAHEIGHLLDEGRLGAVVALEGRTSGGSDAESRADALACRILRAEGIDEGAMARALKKVKGSGRVSGRCERAIGERIGRLARK